MTLKLNIMKNLRAENVEILKTKVKLTISLEVNEYDIKDYRSDSAQILRDLLNLAIENGESLNILKQAFDTDGKIKINSKHKFI